MALIKNKKFAKKLLKLAFPILLQEIVTSLIASLSLLMIGAVFGDEGLPTIGVGLALKVFLIFRYLIIGVTTASTIFVAQYYGRGDIGDAKKYYYCALRVSIVFSLLFFVISMSFPNQLISIFLKDSADANIVVGEGAKYLRIFSISFLFFNLSYVNSGMLKNVHKAYYATISTASALIVDILLLYLFLFVFKYGVEGAAIAIVITRAVEWIFSWAFLHFKSLIHFNLKDFFTFDTDVFKHLMRHFIPTASSKIVWVIGTMMITFIIGQKEDLEMLYVVSMASEFIGIIHCLSSAIAATTGILIGQELGVNHIEQAKSNARDVVVITLVVGFINAALLMLCLPLCHALYSTSSDLDVNMVKFYFTIVFVLYASQFIQQAFNSVSLSGLFLAGGNTITFTLLQLLPQWLCVIPLGFVGLYCNWSSIAIVATLYMEESVRCIFAVIHYRSNRWARNVIKKKPIIPENSKLLKDIKPLTDRKR